MSPGSSASRRLRDSPALRSSRQVAETPESRALAQKLLVAGGLPARQRQMRFTSASLPPMGWIILSLGIVNTSRMHECFGLCRRLAVPQDSSRPSFVRRKS